MRLTVLIVRFLVGLLFIFSGIVKLNDPMGLAFKLEEYFSPEVLHLSVLEPYTLGIAIFLIYAEIVLGVMLLIRSYRDLTLYSLLAMVVFFTFLTFYSAYFDKVTDCGCFGDAISFTPWQSFSKDVILLLAIAFLIWKREWINPPSGLRFQLNVIGGTLIFCALVTYKVLNHLPISDFRPFKEGASILEGMVVPASAQKPVYEYDWIFEKDGKEYVITTNGEFPQDPELGEFTGKEVKTRLIEKGYEPPIKNFNIIKDDTDFAAYFLDNPRLLLVVSRSIDQYNRRQIDMIKGVTDNAFLDDYTIVGISPENPEKMERFTEESDLNFDYYLMDEVTVKTIVRSNPGFLILNRGVIEHKVHYKDAGELPIKNLKESPLIP